ncbi:hypothetical protein [Tenacibaculum ovolyticum]|uniref:hypothetical protein n=1 Tax=Tenacibaculum ovolyticum TaxID=104270 RepID=UPI0007EDFF9F|nr:hypothetical protein [Tenacibaculum ovolyticum]
MSKYHIKCNFKEKLIEIDISRFFGGFLDKSFSPYYLEDSDEPKTGADLESSFDILPVYMQVKVSEGLKTITKQPSSKRKNRSNLEDVREFRDNLDLDYADDYFLFFKLRKMAKTAIDFQHNILMSYTNTGFSHAFYVAPLSINKKEYEKSLFNKNNYRTINPFYYHHYELKDTKWTSLFGFVPFLRNHISIIPHEEVATDKHYYAYSKSGIDVTWHSPEFISNEPTRLSDAMIDIFKKFEDNKENYNVKQLAGRLKEMPIMKGVNLKIDNPWEIIKLHGDILAKEYEIKQLIFLKRKK